MVRVSVDRFSGAAAEGLLFAHDVVERLTKNGTNGRSRPGTVGLKFQATRLTLGGDRRLAVLQPGCDTLFDPVECLESTFDRVRSPRIRLVAVSPLEFEEGWLPTVFDAEPAEPSTRAVYPAAPNACYGRQCFLVRSTSPVGTWPKEDPNRRLAWFRRARSTSSNGPTDSHSRGKMSADYGWRRSVVENRKVTVGWFRASGCTDR